MESLEQQISKEERDDTPEALDKIWEEEAVSFSASSACGRGAQSPSGAGSGREDPVVWAGTAGGSNGG
jgi:nitrate reductase delta subunit